MFAELFASPEPKLSRWYEMSKDRVRAFADVTEDWQAIHLDPDVGRAAGFDGAVVHGYLALSMLSAMSYDVLPDLPADCVSVNYGFDRVRFIAPVPVGARVQGRFQMSEIEENEGSARVRWDVSITCEGSEKPSVVADWLTYFKRKDV
ncbi:MAG: MaoC/PaaZ C-terminal domain-containing protein [Pseudomonadota bacterium]|nr:MaoC/PaaZ C-terminal domain-containing protein [Pseudomonadota bacterium]